MNVAHENARDHSESEYLSQKLIDIQEQDLKDKKAQYDQLVKDNEQKLKEIKLE